MKHNIYQKPLTGLTLAAALLCACNQKQADSAPSPSPVSVSAPQDTVIKVEELREDYQQTEPAVTYEEPLYHLPKDYVFTYTNIPKELLTPELSKHITVYYDTALTKPVSTQISYNKAKGTLSLSPLKTFHYDQPEAGSAGNTDGTWGSYSRFWLVRSVDLATGELLETPIVTLFTTEEDLDTPTLSQSVTADGYYALSWTAIPQADCYKVYRYDASSERSVLEYTTKDISCTYLDFAPKKVRSLNAGIDPASSYFVVAETENGEHSGMSNFCVTADLAGQLPRKIAKSFVYEYTGDFTTALPAYVDVKMLDGSISQYLIDYTEAKVTDEGNGRVSLQASVKNLPLKMDVFTFNGMDYDAFLSDLNHLVSRQEALSGNSVAESPDIDIPFFPEQDVIIEETSAPTELPVSTANSESSDASNTLSLSLEVQDTVFANSPMGAWIALHMLAHEENISLEGFEERTDSELLLDTVWEAYNQNPLIGIVDTLSYDYATNSLLVTYRMSQEETIAMQTAVLEKVAELTETYITDTMSDYEKVETINRYLCEHGTYYTDIFKYIREDGTVDPDAVSKNVNAFTPYGILLEGTGVCESYAEAFLLLAKAAGVDAIIETGMLDGISHEWNRVKIEEQWYTMDVTNNDNDCLPNAYFNLPDETANGIFLENKKALLDSCIGNYTSIGYDNNYYVQHNLTTDDTDQAITLLSEQFASSRVAAILVTEDLSTEQLQQIGSALCAQEAIDKLDCYYKNKVVSYVKP